MTEANLFTGSSVCVVGNVNRDVKLQDVPASAALFEDGETSMASIVETVGGGGANSACAAAALGARVRFVGKVGADGLGERLRRALEVHGVEPCLARDRECATGTTIALGLASGKRHFLSCLPNNEALQFADLDLDALDGGAHLLRADVWFSKSMLEGGNLRLFKEARRRAMATSLDVNFDPYWSTGDPESIARRNGLVQETLGLVDLVHGNTRELCEFTGHPELEDALRQLTDWGVKAVVVHLGSRGAGFWIDGKLAVEPPSPVQRMVNTTGSGDVLSICMILLHSRTDLSIQEKLRVSNQVVAEFMEGRRKLIPEL